MSVNQRPQVAYGLSQPNFAVSPMPILSKRAPLGSDSAEVGTLWIDEVTNGVWACTSIINNVTSWLSLGITPYGAATNGELLIGSTGNTPVWASVTAGANITLTPGAGTLSIAATAGAITTWSTVVADTPLVAAHAYVNNKPAALCTFTLPALALVGDTFQIAGLASNGWSIVENANQYIIWNDTVSTPTTGSLSSANQYDNVVLTCIVANLAFTATSSSGALVLV